MALIEWREEFNTGDAGVDHEHRELVELINALHARLDEGAARDEVEGFLGEVYARISSHFALEERLMRSAGYSGYSEHKESHEALLDEIREIMIGYDAGAFEAFDADLAQRLNAWFSDHFSTFDTDLHRVLPHSHG